MCIILDLQLANNIFLPHINGRMPHALKKSSRFQKGLLLRFYLYFLFLKCTFHDFIEIIFHLNCVSEAFCLCPQHCCIVKNLYDLFGQTAIVVAEIGK